MWTILCLVRLNNYLHCFRFLPLVEISPYLTRIRLYFIVISSSFLLMTGFPSPVFPGTSVLPAWSYGRTGSPWGSCWRARPIRPWQGAFRSVYAVWMNRHSWWKDKSRADRVNGPSLPPWTLRWRSSGYGELSWFQAYGPSHRGVWITLFLNSLWFPL